MIRSALPPTIPASSCAFCPNEQGIVSDDQANNGNGHQLADTRFYCPKCLRVWTCNTEAAELQGRFLDRAGLRARPEPAPPAPPAAPTTRGLSMRAFLDAIADEVQGKASVTAEPDPLPEHETTAPPLHAERLRDLAEISAQLAGELDKATRRALMQRWADLTLLLAGKA